MAGGASSSNEQFANRITSRSPSPPLTFRDVFLPSRLSASLSREADRRRDRNQTLDEIHSLRLVVAMMFFALGL